MPFVYLKTGAAVLELRKTYLFIHAGPLATCFFNGPLGPSHRVIVLQRKGVNRTGDDGAERLPHGEMRGKGERMGGRGTGGRGKWMGKGRHEAFWAMEPGSVTEPGPRALPWLGLVVPEEAWSRTWALDHGLRPSKGLGRWTFGPGPLGSSGWVVVWWMDHQWSWPWLTEPALRLPYSYGPRPCLAYPRSQWIETSSTNPHPDNPEMTQRSLGLCKPLTT